MGVSVFELSAGSAVFKTYSLLAGVTLINRRLSEGVVNKKVFDCAVSLSLWSRDRGSFLEERPTRHRKVSSSSPGRRGGRIFFSRVNFVC